MYGSTTDTDVRHAMLALREAGVVKVSIHFSGGNDEGGADDFEFLDAEGNKVTMPSSHAYSTQKWNSETKTYGPTEWRVHERTETGYADRAATDEEVKVAKIAATLEHPIYDRWGSFAGEFYVDGTLTWDVATGKHTLEGQESHEVWESF